MYASRLQYSESTRHEGPQEETSLRALCDQENVRETVKNILIAAQVGLWLPLSALAILSGTVLTALTALRVTTLTAVVLLLLLTAFIALTAPRYVWVGRIPGGVFLANPGTDYLRVLGVLPNPATADHEGKDLPVIARRLRALAPKVVAWVALEVGFFLLGAFRVACVAI